MKASFLALLLSALAIGTAAAQNPGDNVFAGTKVHTIKLRFPQPRYWDSLTTYYSKGDEQYIAASAVIDGVQYDSIGVRLKGNSSYSHPNNKKSFRLSFDEYRDGQRWDDLKGVHLNNFFSDPSFMREKIHLDFCRDAGIPAPRANYAEVYINDTLFAFYSLIEHVDKRFLGTRFGNKDGNLFKAVDAFGGGNQLLSDFRWYGAATSSYTSRYEFKTDESTTGWSQLVEFLDTLNNSAAIDASLPKKLDMTTFYRAMASDLLFANLDSYISSGRNFYVYFDPVTGKLQWIIWDTNMSFGGFSQNGIAPETLSITYSAANRPLVGKIFGSAALKKEYLQAFCTLFTTYFSSDRIFPHIDSVATIIRPYVYADTRKMYNNAQFETNITSDLTESGGGGGGGRGRKPGLKSFITARTASVRSQLSTLGISCDAPVTPTVAGLAINEFMADNKVIQDPSGEFDDWIELHNTTGKSIDLGGLYLSDNLSQPAKWQFPAGTTIAAGGYLIVWADEQADQAGLHASFKLSASGEAIVLSDMQMRVIDSVTFGAQTANLSMARRPNGRGAFVQGAPTFNASNDLAHVPVGVVINEFMAANTTIHDPAGELDGWIELYNTTDASVDLGGLYLSDSYAQPDKWQFPAGTTIAAGGYLIVWADKDLDQPGVHAGFALSPDGGEIVLSEPDQSVIDSVMFGAQTTDRSMARRPNGRGAFVQGVPTFNAPNNVVGPVIGVVINEFMADNDSIPNPAEEYADWIELYNRTDASVDLSGLYLSDNLGQPAKWQFPAGTTIAAGGYLIVWADEKLAQEGVHAGFKLSSGGESIVLSGPDLGIIDSVTFGPQVTNQSMARRPNGTGAFVQGVPTFNGSNDNVAGVDQGGGVAGGYLLGANRPNPFASFTAFDIDLPQAGHASLRIFDAFGREVATLLDGEQPAGRYVIRWDAREMPGGAYFYTLRAGAFSQTRGMILAPAR